VRRSSGGHRLPRWLSCACDGVETIAVERGIAARQRLQAARTDKHEMEKDGAKRAIDEGSEEETR
jgi:hypothetical protein